jgi:hypothetical protein
MSRITITCPITWWERCNWVAENCKGYKDATCWSAWNIGYDDIYFEVNDKDAMWYHLIWGCK